MECGEWRVESGEWRGVGGEILGCAWWVMGGVAVWREQCSVKCKVWSAPQLTVAAYVLGLTITNYHYIGPKIGPNYVELTVAALLTITPPCAARASEHAVAMGEASTSAHGHAATSTTSDFSNHSS